MIVRLALVAVLALPGCNTKAKEGADEAPTAAVVDVSRGMPDASVDASADADVRVTRLTTNDLIAADAAPGPDGTLFITAIARDPERMKKAGAFGPLAARLYEWDVAGARVIHEQEIEYESAEVWAGEPAALRIATSDSYAYVAAQLRHGGYLAIHAFAFGKGETAAAGRTGLPALAKERFGTTSTAEDGAVDVSIAAAHESWMAVTYRPGPQRPLEIHLYSTPVERWEEISHKTLVTERSTTGVPPHDVAFVDGRLYVAEQPSPTETRVSELAVPSLQTKQSFSIHHAKDAPGGTQLLVRRFHLREGFSRLLVLDRGTLVEPADRSADEKRTAAPADDMAISVDGDPLTATGPGTTGFRGDVVAPLHGKALCTPTWARRTPLLVCTESPEGPSVVRFRPAR